VTEPLSTFLFADLAGYTAMTEAHGDQTASDLAGEFVESVRDLMPAHHAEEVKLLGDAVMVRGEDPVLAVGLGLRLVREVGTRHGRPAVRVGMHTGPAVHARGDWFGATVNVAARISSLAKAGQVLVTEGTRTAAGRLCGVDLHPLGDHRLRNVREAVRLYAAESTDDKASPWPIDPVCRMAIDPGQTAGRLIHGQTVFYFCSPECMSAFRPGA
jgi:class 3 adenylate cyclase/YHS domain-containing protein